MGLPKLWGKDKEGNRGFAFSHVKTIYYNWASKILLKTKLDEMDALIDAKIAKAMMSNQQVNDANKVPTSALAYLMSQNITKNANDISDINGNLGDIKYAVISDPSSVNPLDLLKNKWNELELNKIYLIKINITSAYVALVQKYSSHNYGSAIIFSYTVSTERPIYVQIQAGGWAETTLITNTDFDSRFEAYFKRNALNQGVIKLYNDNSILIFDQHSIELRESNGITVWKTTIGT